MTNTPSQTSGVQILEVAPELAGQRIDNFLRNQLKGVPKTLIYRILRKGEVRVNKGRIKPEYKLQAGDLVRVPPLRERIEDVGGLFRVFLSEARGRMGLPPMEVDEQSFSDLFARQWRGNIRELRNHADRYAMGLDGQKEEIIAVGLNAQMEKIEKHIITDCLKRNNGQVTQTCEELQVPRKTLYDRMKRHNIQPEHFRKS